MTNLAQNVKITRVLNAVAAGQTAQNGAVIDMANLAGTAVSIADTEDNELLVLDIYRPAERYVRAVVTRGTADAVIDGVIAIQYGGRVLPASQDATVAGIETHVSPAEGTA